MTDKQIIIDGVDVKDCIAYAKSQTVYLGNTVYKQMEKICMLKNQPCKFFDCQFKQMARELKAKEQECEELKKIINEAKNSKLDLNSFFAIEATVGEYQLELDQLKAEVKSKTEYIKEQRDIINQYSKEIEMYKKCQGKRASKREEELKAENKILKEKFEIAIKNNMDKTLLRLENGDVKEELQEIREEFGIETLYCHDDNTRVHRCLDVLKLKDTLTEIKEIAENAYCLTNGINKDMANFAKQILQKISECEGNDETN